MNPYNSVSMYIFCPPPTTNCVYIMQFGFRLQNNSRLWYKQPSVLRRVRFQASAVKWRIHTLTRNLLLSESVSLMGKLGICAYQHEKLKSPAFWLPRRSSRFRKLENCHLRFFFAAVNVKITVFFRCDDFLQTVYRRLGRTYCLHLQKIIWRWRPHVSPKRW
jgi:hypothetical protein